MKFSWVTLTKTRLAGSGYMNLDRAGMGGHRPGPAWARPRAPFDHPSKPDLP